MKIETSAKQQGPPGVAYTMQGKQRMTEVPPAEDEDEAIQEENNDVMEDLANIEQLRGVSWPYGRYALPRPAAGCPSGWSIGSRYQDNEDHSALGAHGSVGIETRMNVAFGPNLRMNQCVKNSVGPFSSGSWPTGSYCIARKGGSCPTGFTTGSVYWDDEDTLNVNSHSGVLPDGIYGANTEIYFCCRSDGNTFTSIILPTTSPFILYRFGWTTSCQRVAGMSVHHDYILTNDEDTFNNNHCTGSHPAGPCGRDIRINFCYYYKYY